MLSKYNKAAFKCVWMNSVWDASFAVEERAGGLAHLTDTHQHQSMKKISAQEKVPESELNEGGRGVELQLAGEQAKHSQKI